MQVSLKYAEEHLADLVSAAYRGEEVEIAAPDQPLLRLTLAEAETSSKETQPLLGIGKGEIWLADDWDSPETNAEIADLFENSEIFPDIDPDIQPPETPAGHTYLSLERRRRPSIIGGCSTECR